MTTTRKTADKISTDFNSHAHVERDINPEPYMRMLLEISTHTLTWSVTEYGHAKKGGKGNFNSHAHVERDQTSTPLLSAAG